MLSFNQPVLCNVIIYKIIPLYSINSLIPTVLSHTYILTQYSSSRYAGLASSIHNTHLGSFVISSNDSIIIFDAINCRMVVCTNLGEDGLLLLGRQ